MWYGREVFISPRGEKRGGRGESALHHGKGRGIALQALAALDAIENQLDAPELLPQHGHTKHDPLLVGVPVLGENLL